MLKSKAFDTSLAELVYVLSVVMYDITTQFVGVVYLWSAWLFDYRLREETRWMIMRRPDHCWSTMSRQTRTDQSRTPIWSKCHHATPCASKNMVYIHTKNYGTITAFLLVVWSHIIGTENVIHSVICLKSTKNHYILSTKRVYYNDFTYNVPVLMENLFNKNGNLTHSWFVCNYFCSTVKLKMASCTLPHSQQFWDPWVLGLSWVTALLPYLNSAKSKTQACSSAQRKLPGLGYVKALDPVVFSSK